jgi:hypothetical protein
LGAVSAFSAPSANALGLGAFASVPEYLVLLELQQGSQLSNQRELFMDRLEVA